jgi:cysteinyl-tRNA synthetase
MTRLRLYDTLQRELTDFEPIDPNRVLMYVCGPTVYDSPHLGHARAAVVFDVLFRELRHRYGDTSVVYLRNYTDVDDKIIQRSLETGVPIDDVTAKYIAEYEEAMRALGCLEPTIKPRVTEVMPDILAFIERLIAADAAYVADGDVYYDVSAFPQYGKLSGRTVDELETVHRIEPDPRKRRPLDFALWKAAKPGEPAWDSPWGPGRPGWHIECSVMATKFGRDTLDIHGGGQDLQFPHHENEIAQCEVVTHAPFARTWVHNGFVRVNAEKMSKSLRNFITVGELVAEWPPVMLRYLLLSAHYRTPLDFDVRSIIEAAKAVLRLADAFERAGDDIAADVAATPKQQRALAGLTETLQQAAEAFDAALAQDLNSALALGKVFEAARESNRVLGGFVGGLPADAAPSLAALGALRDRLVQRLGLDIADTRALRADWNRRGLLRLGLAADAVDANVAERTAARAARDWAAADALRESLSADGILVEDGADGSRWSVDPEALLQSGEGG